MNETILRKLVSENLSQMQIAKRLDTSQTNVRYWLSKYDLQTIRTKVGSTDKIFINSCKFCYKEISGKVIHGHRKYCDTKCQQGYHQEVWVNSWLNGDESGVSGKTGTSSRIKRYLKETRGNRCELCTWNEINETTGKVPIELDHIDGDYKNNRPENLRLLCPNCHSLTPNFRALNKKSTRER